jgi:hypothetical protein
MEGDNARRRSLLVAAGCIFDEREPPLSGEVDGLPSGFLDGSACLALDKAWRKKIN